MPVPVRRTPSGTWLVDEPAPEASGRVVAYCRVSSADRKPDLDRQVARVVQGATGLGLPVTEVVPGVGSGLNGRRRKPHRLLSDPQAAVIVVEHRDRPARFGVEHLEAVLSASGRRLVVLDPDGTTDDPVRDITEVPASMCARPYGIAEAELTDRRPWSLPSPRKAFDAGRNTNPRFAGWWADNAKEAYNTGLANAAAAFDNYAKSKQGTEAERAGGAALPQQRQRETRDRTQSRSPHAQVTRRTFRTETPGMPRAAETLSNECDDDRSERGAGALPAVREPGSCRPHGGAASHGASRSLGTRGHEPHPSSRPGPVTRSGRPASAGRRRRSPGRFESYR